MEHIFSGQAQVSYAGFWRRVAAAIVDQIALSIINSVLGGILGFAVSFALVNAGMSKQSMSVLNMGIGFLLGTILCWAYYAVMESSDTRATFGKMLLSIQVASLQGEQISFARATGRYWAKALFHLLCVIGGFGICMGFCVLLSPSLKDTISGVVIVFLILFFGILIIPSLLQIIGIVAFFRLSPHKQMMHDLMAGTVVIKKSDGLGQIPN